jgi:formyltetrahydrofolate synthetase
MKMIHISEVAKQAGIPEEYLEQYGKHMAKIDLTILQLEKGRQRTRLASLWLSMPWVIMQL